MNWFKRNKVATVLAIASIVVFGGTFGFIAIKNAFIKSYLAEYKPPPITVSTMLVENKAWMEELNAVGTVAVENGVDISAEVAGIVRSVSFKSGQDVKAGEILVSLDDAVEQADLRAYQAQLALARMNNDRDKLLLSKKALSKTDFDAGEARLKEIEAQVQRTMALIEQKRIRAPFSGRLGIREVNVGQFVDRGKTLVSLQALEVVHVDFNVPEQFMPKLQYGQDVAFAVQAWPGEIFKAEISAINPKIDPATRNVRVRATLHNSAGKLLPGMFANINVDISAPTDRLVVIDSAVSQSLYGDSAYVVVKADNKALTVERKNVKVGERRGQWVEIIEGLKKGDEVVTAGHIKLTQGAEIIIDNSIQLVKP